ATGSKLTMGGGIYNTNGHNQTLSTLAVNSNSTVNFGAGPSVLTFSGDSSSLTWGAGAALRLNWNGLLAGGGTDQVKVAVGDMSPSQLSAVHFTGYLPGGTILNSGPNAGEVVPASSTVLKRGDIDQNGVTDAGDIGAIMAAMKDLSAYAAGTTTIRGNNTPWDAPDLADVADL